MALQDMVRWLLPRNDDFFVFIERQAQTAHLGAKAFAKFAPGVSAEDVAKQVEKHEQEGDKIVEELEDALQRTFVTPIDREDIQRLSSELDDIVDFTHQAARTCMLFGVDAPTDAMSELIAVVVASTQHLEAAVPSLRKHDFAALMRASRTLRLDERKADGIYRAAMSKLFHDDAKTAKDVIKEMTVLEHLKHAVDRCEHVAHTLANLAVKHG